MAHNIWPFRFVHVTDPKPEGCSHCEITAIFSLSCNSRNSPRNSIMRFINQTNWNHIQLMSQLIPSIITLGHRSKLIPWGLRFAPPKSPLGLGFDRDRAITRTYQIGLFTTYHLVLQQFQYLFSSENSD